MNVREFQILFLYFIKLYYALTVLNFMMRTTFLSKPLIRISYLNNILMHAAIVRIVFNNNNSNNHNNNKNKSRLSN